MIGTQGHGMVQERFKLYFSIAQHIRVRGAAGGVFPQELGKHTILVLGRKIHRLDINADYVGHRHRIQPILARSEEHTYELQSLMRISYAVFSLKKKNTTQLHKKTID